MSSIIPELSRVCLGEWRFFGQARINLNGTVRDGRKEYQDGVWQRVAEYWRAIGGPYRHLTGKDRGVPWSAAFVSFCMREAGADDRFPYSAGHATYINTAIRDADDGVGNASIVAYRLKGYKLKVGDLIGFWRGERRITTDNARRIGWYQSHTDIVVELGDRWAYCIGGNVMHTVTRRQVRLNAAGELVDRSENWFVVIENRM